MLKDEFKGDEAEAWKPPEEDPIVEQKPYKKKRGRPKKAKTNKIEEKVKQLEKCIKNKDKRITKMENRWVIIRTTIFSAIMTVSIVSLVVGVVCIIFTPELLEGFKNVMMFIGILVTILFLSWLLFFTIIGFVDGYNEENAFGALLMASIPTLIVAFFVIVFDAVSYV